MSFEHGIVFWKKESGNYMTHKGGLSEEDIATLQSLKAGDRIIIFQNNKRSSEGAFHLKLLKYRGPAENKTEEGGI